MAAVYGNELVLGLALAMWLTLFGTATILFSAWGTNHPRILDQVLRRLLWLAPVSVAVSLLIIRYLPWSKGTMGELFGLGRVALISLGCLLLPCVFLGGIFGLLTSRQSGAQMAGDQKSRLSQQAAQLYLWESLGMVMMGAVFHAQGYQWSINFAAFLTGILLWSTAACWLPWKSKNTATHRGVINFLLEMGAVLGGLLALLYCTPAGAYLPGGTWFKARLWGYSVIEERESPHAKLAVLKREDQFVFTAGGVPLFSNQDQQAAQEAVHLALLAHPRPRRVLMIGGFLGQSVQEALLHPVEQIDYVELDDQLIKLARQYAPKELSQPLNDSRVHVINEDARRVVAAAQPGTYDVILLDYAEPTSLLLNRFFTVDFFQRARRALAADGLMRVLLYGAQNYYPPELAALHRTLVENLREVFGQVQVWPGAPTMFIAFSSADLLVDSASILSRLAQRNLQAEFIQPATILDRTLPFKREMYLQQVQGGVIFANRDLFPAALWPSSIYWLRLSANSWLVMAANLLQQGARYLAVVAVGLFLLGLIISIKRQKASRGRFAMLAAAYAGTSLELQIIFALQQTRGVLYQEIGLLFTAFMVGLVVGAMGGGNIEENRALARLRFLLAAMGAAAMAVGGMLSLVSHWDHPSLLLFVVAQIVMGILVGAVYPAAAVAWATGRATGQANRVVGSASARIYFIDLLGGGLGALLTGAILLPLGGFMWCWLIAAAPCLGWALGSIKVAR